MKIQSFGCSFLAGDELDDPAQTWPAIIADRLSLGHENHSRGGSGNLHILNQILTHAGTGCICVINWTYIDRFDFCSFKTEQWETLRPVLDHEHAKFYFQNLYGQYRDMLSSLIYVKTAVDFLNQQHIPFVMTYMDYLLFETVDPGWHDPTGIRYLQECIGPDVSNFSGKNFLDWSRANGFSIGKKSHPMDQAHHSAADYWIDHIHNLIRQI